MQEQKWVSRPSVQVAISPAWGVGSGRVDSRVFVCWWQPGRDIRAQQGEEDTCNEVGQGWPGRFLTHRRIDQVSKYTNTKGAEMLAAREGSYTYEKGET